MGTSESRIAPIAALIVMFVVSATIVGLTYWSGDLFGPWTSVPAAVEDGHVEALAPMLCASGAAGREGRCRDAANHGPDAGAPAGRQREPGKRPPQSPRARRTACRARRALTVAAADVGFWTPACTPEAVGFAIAVVYRAGGAPRCG